MAFLQLRSTNPDFSFLISKNPASGLIAKNIRKGVMFGYYTKGCTTEYNIYFRDSANEVSYKEHEEEEFEYLNVSRYNSPLFVLDSIFNMLSTLAKGVKHEKDVEGFEHALCINMVECNSKYLDIFNKSFADYSFNYTPYEVSEGSVPNNYKVVIATRKSLQDLINMVALFCMFHAIKNNHLEIYSDDQILKYTSILRGLDVPYLIRYVFKMNLFRSFNLFKEMKNDLEYSNLYSFDLTFGNAYMDRQRTIMEILLDKWNTTNLVDLGCGEGNFFRLFRKTLSSNNEAIYFGIDPNSDKLKEVERQARLKDLDTGVLLYNSWEQFKNYYEELETETKLTVLCTEVIEHMPIEEAKALILDVMAYPKVERVLITTPNKDFSKYYEISEDAMRDEDHKWEHTLEEFKDWVSNTLKLDPNTYTIDTTGDKVNGTQPTIRLIWSKA